jgi:hypothetical protein
LGDNSIGTKADRKHEFSGIKPAHEMEREDSRKPQKFQRAGEKAKGSPQPGKTVGG